MSQAWAIVSIILALVALVVELHSHTIYLLAATTGLAVAGALGLAGLGWPGQLVVTAALMAGGFPLAALYRRHQPRAAALVPADIGQTVIVVASDQDRLRVKYRGTEWDATMPGAGPGPLPGSRLRITALEGNLLTLAPLPELQTKVK